MKIDKIAMTASLEVRLPYLDHEIIELASRMPTNLKLYNGIEKYILRKAVKDYVPKEILKRKKVGFNEISGELLERLENRKNILSPRYIKIIKRNGTIPYFENRAWNLMIFEFWYEILIENDGSKPLAI